MTDPTFQAPSIGVLLDIWDRFQGVRHRVTLVKDASYPRGSDLVFEIVNVGHLSTSVERVVEVKGWCPGDSERLRFVRKRLRFRIEGTDRTLRPHEPKRFTARPEHADSQMVMTYYRTYRICFTRGLGVRYRVATWHGERIGLARFLWGLARLRLRHRIPKGPRTMEEIRKSKFERGED